MLLRQAIPPPRRALPPAIARRRRPIEPPPPDIQRRYVDARGCYRIFDDAEYLLYWGSTPPAESDTPDDTCTSLPYSPTQTFGDGSWYFSMEYDNGLFTSGFLPVGPRDETYLRIDVASGSEETEPPQGPILCELVQQAGGVVHVLASYDDAAALRADEWAIGYTTDGTDPPADTPDVTVDIPPDGQAAYLDYALPAQSDDTEVRVRVQTRRDDGSWVYSEGSSVLSLTVYTTGPPAIAAVDAWRGELPEDF